MKKLVRIGKIIILAVAFIVVAFPFFWCLMLSFKSNAEIMSIPTTFFPSEWIVSGYKKVLTEAPFMTWLWNSLDMHLHVLILRGKIFCLFVC